VGPLRKTMAIAKAPRPQPTLGKQLSMEPESRKTQVTDGQTLLNSGIESLSTLNAEIAVMGTRMSRRIKVFHRGRRQCIYHVIAHRPSWHPRRKNSFIHSFIAPKRALLSKNGMYNGSLDKYR